MIATTIDTKTCSKCQIEKPLTAFHADANDSTGRKSACKSCRGVVNPFDERDRVELRHDLRVWEQELAYTAPCIVCGGAPRLPENITTVAKARVYLTTAAPRCEAHAATPLPLKARLKAREWSNVADERIATTNLYHDLTVSLMRFAHLRKSYGAKAWLGGKRDTMSDDLMNIVQERFDRTMDHETKRVLDDEAPYLSPKKEHAVAKKEFSTEAADERYAALHGGEESDDFVSLVDRVHLKRS